MTAHLRPKCLKVNKSCIKSVVKHNCWTAIILGALMLALGIVLRSSVINSTSATVASSGMLFILIGIFVICMGPFAAIYDLLSNKNRNDSQTGAPPESAQSPSPSDSSDPPSYNQVMVGSSTMKTPSATYHLRYTQQILSPQNLSDDRPPPPTYEEVVLELGGRGVSQSLSPEPTQHNDTER
ncbi:unnamed protein product [Oppiella nova]|uniref:Uncharacterized protein n=1 Tax=Oppiella nova TaxID=334625 RepID=A0A7R9QK46_9ACAR|nr:unnamed protein product [Oppiella nova]CAG2166903.1 unnamed protein product [Oppiella nova]